MPRPPRTPPASDLEGVDRDEVRNVDAAIEAGQDAEDLERARREGAARPDYSDEHSADDRSR